MSLIQEKMLKIGKFIIRIFELLKFIVYLMAYITFYTWFALESKNRDTRKTKFLLKYTVANNSLHFRADFWGYADIHE